MPEVKHIFFDFDGTLVDSADGILHTLRNCIERASVTIRVELSRRLIGQPLPSLLDKVVGPRHPARRSLELDFRAEYDERGYLSARPYAGIQRALQTLIDRGVSLHLLTNKRRTPVLRIVEMLDWSDSFSSVNTLDSTPGAVSKSDVMRWALAERQVLHEVALMVGDSLDDQQAAGDNAVPFAWASWGYGQEPQLLDNKVRLDRADDLVSHVLKGHLPHNITPR